MRAPLRPLRKRLLHGGALAIAWLLLLVIPAQGSPWIIVAAVLLSALQLWIYVFGPNAHEAPPRHE